MHDYVIVGSGASGTAAALALVERGIRPLMLDAGVASREGTPAMQENLYDYRRRADTFDFFIGSDYLGLSDVLHGVTGVAKLNAPHAAYVTHRAAELGPIEAVDFDPIQSFAFGGLANAWGAGLYRFSPEDLADFPIGASELDPFFDRLTDEIGISGAEDDLGPFFGSAAGLLPPLQLSYNAGRLFAAYGRRRESFLRRGIRIGRPRIGALSAPKGDRPACDYSNTEFWQDAPYMYTPAITLERLIGAGQVEYRSGLLVRSWREDAEGVCVLCDEIDTGAPIEVHCRTLLLAAGAINTSKIVLATHGDYVTELPMLENPAAQIPFVLPASIGRRLDTHAFGLVQLNLVYQSAALGGTLQGSIMELTAPLRAEFFGRFPMSVRANLQLTRDLLPAMLLMQLFFPGGQQPPARLSLREDGAVRLRGQANQVNARALSGLLGALRGIGLWTLPSLIFFPETGHAIHYAGTLPMRREPGRYECDRSGLLHGTRSIYIADSASLSSLPAKNMSLGMMANAMRIAASACGAREASGQGATR